MENADETKMMKKGQTNPRNMYNTGKNTWKKHPGEKTPNPNP